MNRQPPEEARAGPEQPPEATNPPPPAPQPSPAQGTAAPVDRNPSALQEQPGDPRAEAPQFAPAGAAPAPAGGGVPDFVPPPPQTPWERAADLSLAAPTAPDTVDARVLRAMIEERMNVEDLELLEAVRARRREYAVQLEAKSRGAEFRQESAPEEQEPFLRGPWGSYVNHECRYCPYSTLDEQAAWLHYGRSHLVNPDLVPVG